ncbi:MAG: 50S ribosomal protein L17 [Candidatus Dormibacteraeota bacterium]|jgi:large subunit ribosomal protein L17|nr:50S ribosomal protein L17 [Candidatus Dormibacteraeota bacterium]
MRHQKAGRKLGRTSAHRIALTKNLATALVEHGRIETTEAKAKEVRRWVEKLVTTAKVDDVHARRQVARVLTREDVAAKLFTQYAERFRDRPGGYTRIIGKGPRPGDGAPVVIMEFVE